MEKKGAGLVAYFESNGFRATVRTESFICLRKYMHQSMYRDELIEEPLISRTMRLTTTATVRTMVRGIVHNKDGSTIVADPCDWSPLVPHTDAATSDAL